jgi:hypothetical protein
MKIAARSYLTAGMAALSAGAIAVSPVQPIPNHLAAAQERAISSLAVNLAATVNPFQAVVDLFTTTVNNGLTLAQYSLQKPFPLLTTIAANQVTYLQELFAGKGNLIWPQIQNNLKTLFEAPLDPGPLTTKTNSFTNTSASWPDAPISGPGNFSEACSEKPGGGCGAPPVELNLLALQIFVGASQSDPTIPNPAIPFNWNTIVSAAPIYQFAASFASGVVMGALGTALSPFVALSNSFNSFGANLTAGKYLDAFYDIVNIPVNMTNAFFNGAGFFDLSPILKAFGFELPAALATQVGLTLGGLLNVTPVDNPVTQYNGGILLDAVGGRGEGFIPDNEIFGLRVGLGGSLVGMGQLLGEKLKVTPPAPGAAVAPAAAAAAPAPEVKAPAVVADAPAPAIADAPAPVVADAPAPVVEAPAPAVADAPAAALEAVAAEVEAPAPQSTSAPAGRQRAAASDNDNAGGGAAPKAGTRGNHARG